MMTLQGLNKYQHAFEITFILYFTYITLIHLVLMAYIEQQSDSYTVHRSFSSGKILWDKYKVRAFKCRLTLFLLHFWLMKNWHLYSSDQYLED